MAAQSTETTAPKINQEYNEFYKSITKDYLDPLAYTHFKAEGAKVKIRSKAHHEVP